MESQRHQDEHLEKKDGMEAHGVLSVDELPELGKK